MKKILKEKYEYVLFLLALIFIAIIVFSFIKTIDFLAVNLNKALSLPEVSRKSIEFNISEAVFILKKRQLIQ